MLGSSQYLFCFVFSEFNLLRSQICSIPSTLKWRKVITRVLGIMPPNSHNGKKSSNPPATGRAKLYDVLDNDQYRHVMMMTLLITTLIISIIMMVITVISLAAFRIGYFLILSLKKTFSPSLQPSLQIHFLKFKRGEDHIISWQFSWTIQEFKTSDGITQKNEIWLKLKVSTCW